MVCSFLFFMYVDLMAKLIKKKKNIERRIEDRFDIFEDIDEKKNEKKKKERERNKKTKQKKKRKISYTILFIFPPHACIYVQKGRATMISRHFFLQATME